MHTAHHRISRFELEGVRYITEVEVHALERSQRHFLDFKCLDRRFQRHGILVQPELHGLKLFNAFVQLFHIQRGRYPIAQIRQLRNALRGTAGSLFSQVLQKIKTWHKFAETTHVWGVAHGVLQAKVDN